MTRQSAPDAASVAATVQSLAVLLHAGLAPTRAWEHLARSGDETARAVRSAEAAVGLPSPALRPYLDSYQGYRVRLHPDAVHHGEPSPAATVIITLDAPIRLGWAGAGTQRHDEERQRQCHHAEGRPTAEEQQLAGRHLRG